MCMTQMRVTCVYDTDEGYMCVCDTDEGYMCV